MRKNHICVTRTEIGEEEGVSIVIVSHMTKKKRMILEEFVQ